MGRSFFLSGDCNAVSLKETNPPLASMYVMTYNACCGCQKKVNCFAVWWIGCGCIMCGTCYHKKEGELDQQENFPKQWCCAKNSCQKDQASAQYLRNKFIFRIMKFNNGKEEPRCCYICNQTLSNLELGQRIVEIRTEPEKVWKDSETVVAHGLCLLDNRRQIFRTHVLTIMVFWHNKGLSEIGKIIAQLAFGCFDAKEISIFNQP